MPDTGVHHEESHTATVAFLRLLAYFRGYFTPYRMSIAFTLVLALGTIGADLMLPQLVRTAIDRHLVVSARRISCDDSGIAEGRRLPADTRLVPVSNGRTAFVLRSADASASAPLDQTIPKGWRLQPEIYYYALATPASLAIAKRYPGMFIPAGRYLFISTADRDRLSRRDHLLLRADDFRGITVLAALFLAVLTTGFLLDTAQMYSVEWTSQKIMHDLRRRVFAQLQSRCMPFFTTNPVGRLVTRATNDVQNLHEMFNALFANIAKDIAIIAGILLILLLTDWKLTLVCFALLPALGAVSLYFSRVSRRAFRLVRIKVAALNARAQENISGIAVVKAFGREQRNTDLFDRVNHENYTANMQQTTVFALFTPLVDLARLTSMALIIWYGGGKVLQDRLSLGVLVLFLYYSRMFFRPIQDLAEKYNIIQSALASLERIYLLLNDTAREPDTPAAPVASAGGAITFRNVSFAYVPGEPVLQDVSFHVPAGTTAAIVGLTGSGKTTVFNLLERFYDVDEGQILIDGTDIRSFGLSDLRGRIASVMQDVFLFNTTVRENLVPGISGVSDKQVWQALKTVYADSVVERLPNGLDAVLVKGGTTLSSGERQLLAFARAVIRDPDIMLLDEATANIDPVTEKRIQLALGKLLGRQTALIIAHRLSTIRHADQIIVLHKGRICEQGTHTALIERRGLYYNLSRLHSDAV